MSGVSILGSTGSVGLSTLDVIRRHRDRFEVVGLAASSSEDALFDQCLEFRPGLAALLDGQAAARLSVRLASAGCSTRVLAGAEGVHAVATCEQATQVMAAIVGAAGLAPTLAAVTAGKRLLLANKEALVLAGPVLVQAARKSGAQILPIDSEHNAIFQCLPASGRVGEAAVGLKRILLTASGGPFLNTPAERLASVTPEQAVAHPNWRMGQKISVDSATLMNKGLELIEACLLFGVRPGAIEVVIHPQSIVHSLVEFEDGSVLAQLGNPDMRVPIAHALAWPDRIDSGVDALNLVQIGRLSFEAPDIKRFPCLAIARSAAEAGGTAPAVVSAANEIAVAAFLQRKLNFAGIPAVIDSVLQQHQVGPVDSLQEALDADAWARGRAALALERRQAGAG